MNKLTLNIAFGMVLLVMTIPATFLGRLFAELCLSFYYLVVGGRFPVYDAIFNTNLGLVIRNFFNESLILFVGLYVTARLSLFLFRQKYNDLYFGWLWLAHCLGQILLLFLLAKETNQLVLLGGLVLTCLLYWFVYKVVDKQTVRNTNKGLPDN